MKEEGGAFSSHHTQRRRVTRGLSYDGDVAAHRTQRTLLARFMMNETAERSDELVRKPILNLMALLARCGAVLRFVEGARDGSSVARTDRIPTSPSSTSWR